MPLYGLGLGRTEDMGIQIRRVFAGEQGWNKPPWIESIAYREIEDGNSVK